MDITVTIHDEHVESECARCGCKAQNQVTQIRYHSVLKRYFAAEVMSPEGWTRVGMQNDTHVHLCPPCTTLVRGRLSTELSALGRTIVGEVKLGGEDGSNN